MSKSELSEKVCQFIFDKIDSVEQLEVLLLLRAQDTTGWNPEMIANELRSSAKSVATRLTSLREMGLVEMRKVEKDLFFYKQNSGDLENTLNALTDDYKVRRQKVLEHIFSPMKKAKYFADAFVMTKSSDKKGDGNDG